MMTLTDVSGVLGAQSCAVMRRAGGTLDRMDMPVRRDRATKRSLETMATAPGRTGESRLERLTAATRRPVVEQGLLRRDRATVSAIVAPVEQRARVPSTEATAGASPAAR
jgi:hypothetical protein